MTSPDDLPEWAPTLEQVADYLPGRTLVRGQGGNTPQGTFNEDTYPTAEQVGRLIAGAVGWVTSATGAVHTSLYGAATAVAAIRTAGWIEQSYPDRNRAVKDTSVDVADRYFAEADKLRADLARANEAAGGTDPTDPAAALLPQFAFPAAPPWADTNL